MPSNQTINHLTGLLEIVNNENVFLKEDELEQKDNFITSLKNKQQQYGKTLKEILIENALEIFETEEIVIFAPQRKEVDNKKSDRIRWITLHISDTIYKNL